MMNRKRIIQAKTNIDHSLRTILKNVVIARLGSKEPIQCDRGSNSLSSAIKDRNIIGTCAGSFPSSFEVCG